MKTLRKIPPIGARIVKSSVAVALCMVIYFLRTLLPVGNGIPFYSALAALWCMQPYHVSTNNNAWQHSAGTLLGAGFGLIFLIVLRAAGLMVNNFRLPVRHNSETLFVSGIDSVLIPEDDSGTQYSKVELNRLIESGVRFTISTIHTPAVVMSLMKGVDLRLPIIVMDGAAMYDIKGKEYLEAEYLPADISAKAEKIIADSGSHCFVNVMYDSTLLIFYGEFRNPAEKELYDSFKHSPYRNYIRSSFRRQDDNEKILYLTVLETKEKAEALRTELNERLGEQVRITLTESGYEGYFYLKVFSPLASKHTMLKKLKERTGAGKLVTFGSVKGEYDVYISDGGGNATVKLLKKLYRNDIYH